MKFLSSLIQPQYIPCTTTRLQFMCASYSECPNKKGYFQVLVDTRTGEECSRRLLVDCSC